MLSYTSFQVTTQSSGYSRDGPKDNKELATILKKWGEMADFNTTRVWGFSYHMGASYLEVAAIFLLNITHLQF